MFLEGLISFIYFSHTPDWYEFRNLIFVIIIHIKFFHRQKISWGSLLHNYFIYCFIIFFVYRSPIFYPVTFQK
jgi:Na+/H+ antiporter NhaB